MDKNVIIRKLDLPASDWKAIAKGLGIAILGSALTYLSANLANANLGAYSYILVPLAIAAVNIARKVIYNDTRNIIGLSVKGKDEPKEEPPSLDDRLQTMGDNIIRVMDGVLSIDRRVVTITESIQRHEDQLSKLETTLDDVAARVERLERKAR